MPSNLTGVPYVNISGGAEFGNNFEGFLPQVGNSFQWSDNLTWVKGTHTFKFGTDVRRQRFDQYYYFDVNGEYTFNNSGANAIIPGDGDQYAEYLLGLADTYVQGSGQREDIRVFSIYPFVQDSWKIRPNLTINYGSALGTEHAANRHQRTRGNVPSGTKLHGASLSVKRAEHLVL